MTNKICPRCKGNGFFKVKESVERQVDKVVQCPMCNSKERYMIKSLMSILILTLSLSHCSSTDFIAIGGAVFTGLEDKPNPVGVIKMLGKKNDDRK